MPRCMLSYSVVVDMSKVILHDSAPARFVAAAAIAGLAALGGSGLDDGGDGGGDAGRHFERGGLRLSWLC